MTGHIKGMKKWRLIRYHDEPPFLISAGRDHIQILSLRLWSSSLLYSK